MALLSNAPRNATIRAATDLEALTIHRDDFTSLHSSIPALRQSIEEAMQRRTNKE
jgi:CRP-like cAMP-binding protein